MSTATTSFVSGANGYIALHLIRLLLANNQKVVGSVRSEAKGQDLKAKFGADFEYVIVPDIVAPHAFDAALQKYPQLSVFYHLASPLTFDVSDFEKELLLPAIEGSRNALKAVQVHGNNIKRVILTSSSAAISLSIVPDRDATINEDTWTQITWEQALQTPVNAYIGSKTFGEKAGWDFVEQEKPHFDLTVVNPTYVFGPQAFDPPKGAKLNLSVSVLTHYLDLKPTDPFPGYAGLFYDVRDVAKAHFLAAQTKEAAGKRLFLVAGPWTPQLVANTLRKHYPQLRETIPEGDPSSTEGGLKEQIEKTDTSRTKKILNFEPISWEKSVTDTFDQIFASQK